MRRWIAFLLLLPGLCGAAEVLVLQNARRPRFDTPSEVLQGALKEHRIRVVSLAGADRVAALSRAAKLRDPAPDLVVAFGDRAAWLAENAMAPAPYVFAVASNWDALGLDRARATGVGEELEPETLASQFGLFLPDRKRVGILYGPPSASQAERFAHRAGELGYTVASQRLPSAWHFADALQPLLARVDVFWLLEDPTVVTGANLVQLREAARAAKVPVVTWSRGQVRQGMTLAIAPDGAAVGAQLAALAKRVLAGEKPGSIPVESPQKAGVVVSLGALAALGIELDPMVLGFAETVE